MNLIIPFENITKADRSRIGGKGYALSVMARRGAKVPSGVCVTIDLYQKYIKQTGLAERISLELSRKRFIDMRWEEIWDASLRIRNMFLTTPLPNLLYQAISEPLMQRFGDSAVVVRSSAPDEDSRRASFAGLHESYVNIRGNKAIVDHVRLVWASLWSDAALLYRRELGLDISKSSMAVIVQEILLGERSGIAFSKDPNNETRAVIEAVYGLNQGLVDGTVEPDRWFIDRKSGSIILHTPSVRKNRVIAHTKGVTTEPLPFELMQHPPLDDEEISEIYSLLLTAEDFFGTAQDIEWTVKDRELFLLQSRPITATVDEGKEDKRSWYLSLRRSFENLRLLRSKIEGEIFPSMMAAVDEMAGKNLAGFGEEELKSEVIRRVGIYNAWLATYLKDLIPFAHGIRLFGIAYNDSLRPKDPYEFMRLLSGSETEGIERNHMLNEMAVLAKSISYLSGDLKNLLSENSSFKALLHKFIERFGDLSCGTRQCAQGPDAITDFVIELAAVPEHKRRFSLKDTTSLERSFLDHFEGQERTYAEELLDLARASYRARDNDNIYLGRIKGQLILAIDEYKRRFSKHGRITDPVIRNAVDVISSPDALLPKSPEKDLKEKGFRTQTRQIVGQPAGPGIASGKARVIADASDLKLFKAGEVLVCDAIDPSITYIVPIASAIVERRGGMLIHGAIIAREYGLACVTGIPNATSLIHTGDSVTVDGYLGIVTITKKEE